MVVVVAVVVALSWLDVNNPNDLIVVTTSLFGGGGYFYHQDDI